ncbi:MAG: transcription termination/antitermination factor NusG [Saprospiraceae bacterium]|nr:transcription termination/antitermination factor NusG [Saprospiraceae bacterium]
MAEETRWYSLRVISGKERVIKERIDKEIKSEGWSDFVTNVVVPTEKIYKIRNGKKMIQERNILPGYILVEAVPAKLKGEIVAQITNLQNVIHFLGKNEPIPMQDSEANRLLGVVDDTQGSGETLAEPFLVGEMVKITDGPFNDFVGEIIEINQEKKKLKVVVKIFGRGTEVELGYLDVEKQQ